MTSSRDFLALSSLLLSLLVLVGVAGPATADPLGGAALQIAGTELVTLPYAQTVPFDTPMLVETHLFGYDASRGVLPADLRVVGELLGPEISSSLRLAQGEEVLGSATPQAVTIRVTKVLITKVSSRAMTRDEIHNDTLVIDEDNVHPYNLPSGDSSPFSEIDRAASP